MYVGVHDLINSCIQVMRYIASYMIFSAACMHFSFVLTSELSVAVEHIVDLDRAACKNV